MTKTFKVGDKVRATEASNARYNCTTQEHNFEGVVRGIRNGGKIGIEITRLDGGYFDIGYIIDLEAEYFELIEPKLTKKARIESLEKAGKEQADFNEATAKDFAELFGRVEELEKRLAEQKGDEPVPSNAITSVNDVKLGDKITVEKGFSNYLSANSSYEVVEVASKKSEYCEKIVVLDDDGDNYILATTDFAKLRKVAS